MSDNGPTWRCSGASVIGTSHEKNGSECQDAWALHRVDSPTGQVLAVCVSDGAGSAANSRVGAEHTSSSMARWLSEHFDRALAEPKAVLKAAIEESRDFLEFLADASGLSRGDYACTIVAAAVRDDGAWVVWHLGDGGVIGQFAGEVRMVSAPQKGEFANVTNFVTDGDAAEQVECVCSFATDDSAPLLGLAVFSDGLERCLLKRHTGEVAEAVGKMIGWHQLGSEQEVSEALRANILEVFRNQSTDDCTLVIISRQSDSEASEITPAPCEEVGT